MDEDEWWICPICFCIMIEPVTMPCEHSLCLKCFKQTIEVVNLSCPICRRRISVWLRKAGTNGLVDIKKWNLIKTRFADELNQDTNPITRENNTTTALRFQKQIAQPGELRQEYEAALAKLQLQREEESKKEEAASLALIKELQEQEEKEWREIEKARGQQTQSSEEAASLALIKELEEMELSALEKERKEQEALDKSIAQDMFKEYKTRNASRQEKTSSKEASGLKLTTFFGSARKTASSAPPELNGQKLLSSRTQNDLKSRQKMSPYPFSCMSPTEKGREDKTNDIFTIDSSDSEDPPTLLPVTVKIERDCPTSNEDLPSLSPLADHSYNFSPIKPEKRTPTKSCYRDCETLVTPLAYHSPLIRNKACRSLLNNEESDNSNLAKKTNDLKLFCNSSKTGSCSATISKSKASLTNSEIVSDNSQVLSPILPTSTPIADPPTGTLTSSATSPQLSLNDVIIVEGEEPIIPLNPVFDDCDTNNHYSYSDLTIEDYISSPLGRKTEHKSNETGSNNLLNNNFNTLKHKPVKPKRMIIENSDSDSSSGKSRNKKSKKDKLTKKVNTLSNYFQIDSENEFQVKNRSDKPLVEDRVECRESIPTIDQEEADRLYALELQKMYSSFDRKNIRVDRFKGSGAEYSLRKKTKKRSRNLSNWLK